MGSLDNNIRLIRNETVEGGNTKERIAETFDNIVAELGKKVDKVAGKGLSSNDYTNEEKQKNEENALKRVANVTVTGDVNKIITITFADSTVMQAPFKDNNDIPLADVHMNSLNFNENTGVLTGVKSDGNEISVSLDGRYSLIGHNHDEQYSPKTHTHSEYSLRTHRHNKDDIDGLPANLATTENVKTAIEGIQIGGRNLVLRSKLNVTNNSYGIASIMLSEEPKVDEKLTVTIKGVLGSGKRVFTLYNKSGSQELCILQDKGNGIFQSTFPWRSDPTNPKLLFIYIYDNSVIVNSTIEWIKIERGNKATDWSPAPEDLANHEDVIQKVSRVGAAISSNWTAVVEHQNNTIFVENSLSIELNQLQNMGSISFIKTFDTGAVTFTCAGKNIIYPFDNTFNGKKGSTAVVSIHNNDCYIRISNV